MKKSLFFFALLISLGYGCYKASDLQTPATQSAIDNPVGVNTTDVSALDRGLSADCCIQLAVASTIFDGIEVCGVITSLDDCTRFTNNCGTSSGFLETIKDKDGVFCVPVGQPFSITNLSGSPITIFLITLAGNTAPVTLNANGTPGDSISYAYDCDNTPVVCN